MLIGCAQTSFVVSDILLCMYTHVYMHACSYIVVYVRFPLAATSFKISKMVMEVLSARATPHPPDSTMVGLRPPRDSRLGPKGPK